MIVKGFVVSEFVLELNNVFLCFLFVDMFMVVVIGEIGVDGKCFMLW